MINVGYPTSPYVIKNNSQTNTSQRDSYKRDTGLLREAPQKDEFRRITKGQIKEILATPQIARSDCYLVSSIKALAKSGFGKQMLKNSIRSNKNGDTFVISYKRYDDKNTYKTSQDEYYTSITGRPDFNPTGAVEKATSEIINDRLSAKPWYLRVFGYSTNLEGNLASCFMKTLTGKEPIQIGDKNVLPLKTQKEETTKLLDKIGDLPINRHSFVAGSKMFGTKDNIGAMHYYVLKGVDKDKKEVHLINPRYVDLSNKDAEQNFIKTLQDDDCSEKEIETLKNKVENMDKVIKLSYDQFMDNFRSIVGYFDEKTEKKNKK